MALERDRLKTEDICLSEWNPLHIQIKEEDMILNRDPLKMEESEWNNMILKKDPLEMEDVCPSERNPLFTQIKEEDADTEQGGIKVEDELIIDEKDEEKVLLDVIHQIPSEGNAVPFSNEIVKFSNWPLGNSVKNPSTIIYYPEFSLFVDESDRQIRQAALSSSIVCPVHGFKSSRRSISLCPEVRRKKKTGRSQSDSQTHESVQSSLNACLTPQEFKSEPSSNACHPEVKIEHETGCDDSDPQTYESGPPSSNVCPIPLEFKSNFETPEDSNSPSEGNQIFEVSDNAELTDGSNCQTKSHDTQACESATLSSEQCSKRKEGSKKEIFSCGYCPSKFTCQSAIVNHMKVHSNSEEPSRLVLVREGKAEAPESVSSSSEKNFTPFELLSSSEGKSPPADKALFTCGYCPLKFTSRSGIVNHMNSVHSNSEGPSRMVLVREKFENEKSLKNFLRRHKRFPFGCDLCTKRFKFQKYAQQHQAEHAKELQCSSANPKHRKIPMKKPAKVHTDEVSSVSKPHKENSADPKHRKIPMKKPVKVHTDEVSSASKPYEENSADPKHRKIPTKKPAKVHTDEVFSAFVLYEENSASSKYRKILMKPAQVHINKVSAAPNPQVKHSADLEYREISKEDSAIVHTDGVSLGLKYSCMLCSEIFFSKRDLQVHEAKHTYQKSYSCEQCFVQFYTEKELKLHERSHADEERSAQSHAKRDLKSQKRKNPKELNTNKNEQQHALEQPYSCTYCSARFSSKTFLQHHKKSHVDEKPYICTRLHCLKIFRYERQLRLHIAERHRPHEILHSKLSDKIAKLFEEMG